MDFNLGKETCKTYIVLSGNISPMSLDVIETVSNRAILPSPFFDFSQVDHQFCLLNSKEFGGLFEFLQVSHLTIFMSRELKLTLIKRRQSTFARAKGVVCLLHLFRNSLLKTLA
jgi:hypothetical protein